MAGDEVAWDQYCLEKRGCLLKWRDFFSDKQRSVEDNQFMFDYRLEYRRLHNLPMKVATELGLERVDISEDGRSNDDIALSTIGYLINLPPEERKQYHVCIGWTSISRFIKYVGNTPSNFKPQFYNLHNNHVGGVHKQLELSNIQSYIDISFRALTDEDFWLAFVRNIMLLENFLINNEITYTFYKALGTANDVRIIGPFPPFDPVIPSDKVTNDSCWYNFKKAKVSEHPYENDSWCSTVIEYPMNHISKENGHPNLKAVNLFAIALSNFIRSQNVL